MSLLSVENLVAAHGLLTAVRGVSFAVDEGAAIAVVGANGAGKTTLLRAISGVHRIESGRIVLDGIDLTRSNAPKRVAAGVAMVPEGRRLFGDMTVRENLLLAGEYGRAGRWTLDAVLDAFPALKPLLDRPADVLSGGQRQAAAIGRSLMCNPRILLLDEVSLGLSPIAVDGLYQSLALLRRAGTTIVLVEQDLDRALGFADRILCMLEGGIALEGEPAALSRADITAAYFGLARAKGGAS
ncbi:MAG TPA: ABC transporter ATP-binding protein [Rhizobiales bacterium]|nr:ABC transporter ATP-binding protein [Hyphomicrobiales bacterium]